MLNCASFCGLNAFHEINVGVKFVGNHPLITARIVNDLQLFLVPVPCNILMLLPQLETNDKQLRKEITFAIKNQFGVRVGLFTPDMAFEAIVKTQLEKLLHPALKCIDLVSSELGAVVQKCGEGVSLSLSPSCSL